MPEIHEDLVLTTFLRNAWYVGAWASEVTTEKPFERLVADEPLAFFRTEAGEAAVIHDMCPHRFAPLSTGRVRGNSLECGYHGFAFDATGACTCIPGQDKIPDSVKVRAYPTIEKWGLIFVWMGDPELANEDKLPPLHYFDHPDWVGKHGTTEMGGNYTLLRDNLMDLTHAKYVHGSTLATDDVTNFPVEIFQNETMFNFKRTMENIERSSPFMHAHCDFKGPVTHWQNVEFHPPCTVLIKVGVHSADGSDEDQRIEFRVLNVLVPMTKTTSRYYWSVKRNFNIDDEEMTEFDWKANGGAFEEDRVIIEKQQEMMNRGDYGTPLAGPHDRAVVGVQKWFREKLEAEGKA